MRIGANSPSPKPLKNARRRVRKTKHRLLVEYRSIQATLCIERDSALCAIHYFIQNERVPYHHIHHVRGRGKEVGDSREHYTSLLCVCTSCHPPPAQNDAGKQSWVVEVLAQANAKPINRKFEHQ